MGKLFGTDGIRGIANQYPMTGEMAMKVGRAAAHVFKHRAGQHRIVIGKDTRLSGYILESALTAGICSLGVDVLLVGPLPTPAIAVLTRSLRADAGIMISASHNPFEDNGIKFFSKKGFKLPDSVEAEIENLITSEEIDHIRPTASDVGKVTRVSDAAGRYIEFVKNSIPKGLDFQGKKVVLDCANGANYKVAPTVLRELGAEVVVLNDKPNGTNINRNCGAIYPEDLQKAVIAHQAHVGIANDGDADRAVFVDEQGRVIPGEAILFAFAKDIYEQGTLQENTIVTTEMSNQGLEVTLNEIGIQMVRTAVGDRYVLDKMLAKGYNFGGEPSGHTIFRDYSTTGDGLIAALQFLTLMQRFDKTPSQLTEGLQLFPQTSSDVRVHEKIPLEEIPELQQALSDYKACLARNGRLLVRYSGTESILRIMVEGKDQEMISNMAKRLASIVEKRIGVANLSMLKTGV
jgi:phosphoglucosamine mutase